MVKESNIMLRVESEQKGRIAGAAKAAGQSLTHFILEAVMERVAKIESSGPNFPINYSRGHCPLFFRTWCMTASTGGAQSYADVGYSLLQALATECPWDIEEDDWFQSLEDLGELLGLRDSDKEILIWFKKYLPRMLAMIPTRRRQSFIEGLRLRYKEEGIEI